MCDEDDLLDIFLSTAIEDNEKPVQNKPRILTEADIFKGETIEDVKNELTNDNKKSLIHRGDTDSSDDEDNRNHEDKKYSDCGNTIKRLLNDATSHTRAINGFNGPRERISWKKPSPTTSKSILKPEKPQEIKKKSTFDVFIDPIFGLRITNPLISSTVLQERMLGRDPVQFSQLDRYLQLRKNEKDWVLAGVIANKSAVKTSQKGNQFLIWTLTDLKDDIKTISVFLFGSAYNQLWKTQVGLVVGILNPNPLDRKEGSKDVVSTTKPNLIRCDELIQVIFDILKK